MAISVILAGSGIALAVRVVEPVNWSLANAVAVPPERLMIIVSVKPKGIFDGDRVSGAFFPSLLGAAPVEVSFRSAEGTSVAPKKLLGVGLYQLWNVWLFPRVVCVKVSDVELLRVATTPDGEP
jgi:hypothetical protein